MTSPVTPSDARVTLAQLAEEAGVSLSTISKVLNGRSDVSRKTRAKVEELLEEHGYKRRNAASKSALLELVFPELESAWALEIIRGVENVAKANGMSVILTESGTRKAPGAGWVEGVMARRPAGVVLVFSDLPLEYRQQLESRSIPFVIIDPAGDPAPDVPSVGSANWAGGMMATRHLIELGHRRIAAISGPEDMMCSLARIDGYSSALNTAGIPIDRSLIRYGDFHVDGGRAHALELLQMKDRPTAIFAGSDLQALGVLDAARQLGLSVPQELSIVGYDDLQVARWSSPALTTVHQPLIEMAEEAARMVLRLREGDRPQNPRLDLATSLVVRQSTASPGAS
ncbi:LacI family transcriptional regulator [Pseudarthrobacter sp. NamE2]|uniref:LacI family DNA-binding transcriptional regulator n=1 Tax=Pseudarthrobacter sp. NamE2 TaxID=2576838 RepID=UPI0010FD793E|nr:LacI family DNA-binding transcriptional regulator [Pseudarthrobacter sp. NamE2]TLM83327.1 LacI family transcriptional regulator [Pseudarthrobacter sp. NamE2]